MPISVVPLKNCTWVMVPSSVAVAVSGIVLPGAKTALLAGLVSVTVGAPLGRRAKVMPAQVSVPLTVWLHVGWVTAPAAAWALSARAMA